MRGGGMDPGAAATFDDGVRDDDVVSLAPSTSTLAVDEHPNARGHRDSPLPRGEDPPSTSKSLRSGLSDGGSTRPFRASVSASAQTWRTRPLSLIVESDGTTSEWVLRVDAGASSSRAGPDERGDVVGSTLVFGGFDASRLSVRVGAPKDSVTNDEPVEVRWVSLARMGAGPEETPHFFYRDDDDSGTISRGPDDEGATTISFKIADAMRSFGSPVTATTASIAASVDGVDDEVNSDDDAESDLNLYRISPWAPGSAASSLRDPTPRVHRPTIRAASIVSSSFNAVDAMEDAMDDTPRRLDFIDGGIVECDHSPVSEGAALLAAVMAEVSTPSRYTGVTDLTHRLGLARPDVIEHTPCSVFQPETSHVEVADADASFESSEGDRSVSYRDELEAAAAAGERVFTPTLARAMRRVTDAAAGSKSPMSASTVSAHTQASSVMSARVPILEAWRSERTMSAAFRVWRMSAVLTRQQKEREELLRLRREAIAGGIQLDGGSPIAYERMSSPASSSVCSRETFSFGLDHAPLPFSGAGSPVTASASATTQTPHQGHVNADHLREGESSADTEDAAECARSATELRKLKETIGSTRALLLESETLESIRREREARRVASFHARVKRRVVGNHFRGWWASTFREVTARRLAAAAQIAADCHVVAAEGAVRADAFIAHAHNRAVRARHARIVTRAFDTWAERSAKTSSLRRRLAWGKVSADWREKRSAFARWVAFVDTSVAEHEARLVAVTRILTRVFARAIRLHFTEWRRATEDARRARLNAFISLRRFAARREIEFGRVVSQAWRAHVMEGIGKRRVVMARLDAEDRVARSAFLLCARHALRRGRERVRSWRTYAAVRRRDREIFERILSSVRRAVDDATRDRHRAVLGSWRHVASASVRRRRTTECVDWAVDSCIRSARLDRTWRTDDSFVTDALDGWRLAVRSTAMDRRVVESHVQRMARHRDRGTKRRAMHAWREWWRTKAGEWENVAKVRTLETRARTHRFNARVRARLVQFRAWRLECAAASLGRERRWRKLAAVTVNVAVQEGARRTVLFARLFRDWHRIASAAARAFQDAASHTRTLSVRCEQHVHRRYCRTPFRRWRKIALDTKVDRAVLTYAKLVWDRTKLHASRMFSRRCRVAAKSALHAWRTHVDDMATREVLNVKVDRMFVRRAETAVTSRCVRAWRAAIVKCVGSRRKSDAVALRVRRRRAQSAFDAWRWRTERVKCAVRVLDSLARFERAKRGLCGDVCSDALRGWLQVASTALETRAARTRTLHAVRRLARGLRAAKAVRVLREWYVSSGAGVAAPERRRAHDVILAGHRKARNASATSKAFHAFRLAAAARVAVDHDDAARLRIARVATVWRHRRVLQRAMRALRDDAARAIGFRESLQSVASFRLKSLGSESLRAWRNLARVAARSRDVEDRADASAARCAVRSGRRYFATWRRAVAARVASTALEERATRFSEHRRKGNYLRPAFHAWSGYYDRITVARLMYERTLMSAARLRSRIERRFMSRRFASWSAGAVASASLERRRVRFATDRTRRVAATCVLTWQWLVTASRETRAHAHGAVRDRAVRCVRAWRRHVSDKSERQTRLKKSYANVVKSRAKRTLRVWLRHALQARAKRMKYMESSASRRERVVDERYGRYVFHAWRWHVAWSRGYAETVAENVSIANAERTRRAFNGWRRRSNTSRRLAACERRVVCRRAKRIALECVWALAIHASKVRRLRSFAARRGYSPSPASSMAPGEILHVAFTDWRTQAIESVAERERDALMARGALARARRTRCPAIVREWRRLARRTKRLNAVADERASVRARRLTFRAFRAFVASTLDALGARERELTRAMEVRMRAREVLAEAEMIAGRTSVEFEEPEAAAEAEAALAPVHIAALPAPSAHPSPGIADTQVTTAVIPPASQSPRHRVESIDESAIFDLSADDLDVVDDVDTDDVSPPAEEQATAVTHAAPQQVPQHSREYEVAYRAAYDAALAAAAAEAAARRRASSTPAAPPTSKTVVSAFDSENDKENAGVNGSIASDTYAKVYHGLGGGTKLGVVRGARTTKALAAADAVLGRNSRDFALAGLNPNPRVGSDGDALLKVLDADPYTYRSAESYSRVYHHR